MRFKNFCFVSVGIVALILGAIGILLPIVPTTPFVLLSAGCFSVGNPKLSKQIRKSKYFGSYIEHYYNKTGVPREVKIRAIIFLWAGLILSMVLVPSWIVRLVLVLVGISVTLHLKMLKSR